MESRSRVPQRSARRPALQSPPAIKSREDAELAAIALLCLVYAWLADEPPRPQLRLVSK